MPTFRLCKFCGDLHDVENWPDNHREWLPDNRNYDLAAPSVIDDNLDYVKSMADGKRYTSKRQIRAEYRARGVVEVGDQDPGAHRKRPDRNRHRQKVSDAVDRAANIINQKTDTRVLRKEAKALRKRNLK